MSKSNIVSFDQLWEKVEKLSTTKYTSITETIDELVSSIQDLKKIHSIHTTNPTSEVGKELRIKEVGKILFLLTALSDKANIDVYKALKDQYDTIKFKDQLTLIGFDEALENTATSSNGVETPISGG